MTKSTQIDFIGEKPHYRYFQDRLFVDKFPNGAVYDPKIAGRGPQL